MKVDRHGRYYTTPSQGGGMAYVVETRAGRIVELMLLAPPAWPELEYAALEQPSRLVARGPGPRARVRSIGPISRRRPRAASAPAPSGDPRRRSGGS